MQNDLSDCNCFKKKIGLELHFPAVWTLPKSLRALRAGDKQLVSVTSGKTVRRSVRTGRFLETVSSFIHHQAHLCVCLSCDRHAQGHLTLAALGPTLKRRETETRKYLSEGVRECVWPLMQVLGLHNVYTREKREEKNLFSDIIKCCENKALNKKPTLVVIYFRG